MHDHAGATIRNAGRSVGRARASSAGARRWVAVAVIATMALGLGASGHGPLKSIPATAAAPSAAVLAGDIVPTPAEGDGFWFSAGVQATLLNRVVRMAPDTPAAIRSVVADVVRQVNAASGAGVVIGADTSGPPARTEIVVRAPTQTVCGPSAAGCASTGVAAVDGYGVVVNALVEIDRDLLGSGYETPILLHEMGHAMGLGHYDRPYDGLMQIMWNSVTPDMTTYRTGDRNGLAALGAVFTNRNVTGNIDRLDLVPGGIRLRGWALDLDAPALTLDVSASLDGTATADTADAYRPDVGAVYPAAGPNHGVDLFLPSAGLEDGLTMCLVATGGRGQDVGIGCRATTAPHSPLGSLDVARQRGPTTVEASGWALDPDSAGNVEVEVTIDGVVVSTSPTDVPRSDVTRAYPGFPGPRGWSTTVSDVAPGTRRLCARARDLTGNPNRTIGCRTIAVGSGNPIGTIDGVAPDPSTPLLVRGWAIDPDVTTPVDVHLYVDGRYSRTATANRSRPDVGRAYPGYGDAHGFAVTLPGLARGPHVACVFAINAGTGSENTLLGCQEFVTAGTPPVGNVDAVRTEDGRLSLVGWAIDPDTIDPIEVHLWADNRYLTAGTANRNRPDVGRAFPTYGAMHGFAIPVDRLAPGGHRVCAFGINAGTSGPNPLLGCRWVQVD